MSFPKPDAPSRAYFESVLPEDPRVQARPMFGNLAGFVNGNMFIGLFGSAVFVRLSEEDRAELLKEDGAAIFEPQSGRPMKEYVAFPEGWRRRPKTVRKWVGRSLDWVAEMPPKTSKARAKKK